MSKDKSNVVFIMTDQQRADSFGPNRHPCADFPVLERLAGQSVSFTNCFTAASPCVPSRHSFLTGRQPWSLGCHSNAKFSTHGEESWMSVLRENDYACVSVGKTHMVHSGSFHIPIDVGRTFGEQGGWNHFNPEATPEAESQYFDIRATQRACDVIGELKGDPFALFLGLHAPHEPYVMPEKYLAFCKPDEVQLPESCYSEERAKKSQSYHARVKHFQKMFGEMTDEDIRKGIAGHHCLMKMVDDCLGQVLDCLEEHGLADNTLLVYTSDHGDVLGEHRIFNKAATFYDSEVRIPMLVRFPDGRHSGKCVNGLVSSIDFVPTLFDVLGLDADMRLPGRSMLPMVADDDKGRDYVTCATTWGMMIRTERHKFWTIVDSDGEMYDLESDPGEIRNLYHDPDHTDLKLDLTAAVLNARMKDDRDDSRPTRQQKLLHREVSSSGEPET